jgi:EmrB/QacA subfamily drug resistance transporter
MTRLRDNPWIVLLSLCLGFFMILLDTTIVNIAIPSMIDGLDASLDEILWVVNAYVLVYAVLLITAGRLGDMWGPKVLFLAGMALFTLASVACGLADSPAQLITARVVQAVGGAMLTPQSLSVITQIFPPERRGAAFGVWGAVAGAAALAGPTLGGLIVTHWGWQWIFYVNVPVGIASFAFAAVVVPNLRTGRDHHLDLLGTALVTAGLFLVTFGLIEGERYDWGRIWGFVTIPELIVAGLVLTAIFLVVQYREKGEPLVPFEILRNRNFSLMNWVGAAMSFGMLGLFIPLTIYLQSVLGLSALEAGLTFAPMSLVSIFISPVGGGLADRFGGKYVLLTGLTLFASGMGSIVWIASADASRWDFLPGLILAGFGMGFTFASIAAVGMRDVDPRMAGAASGVMNTTRQLGAVIGSAAVGALLQAQLADRLPAAAERNAAGLPPAFRGQFVHGFEQAGSAGLQVGRGQTGASAPKGLPAGVAEQLHRLAEKTFQQGFTDAMRPSLSLAIAVLAAAAVSCVLITSRRKTAPEPPVEQPEAAPIG